MAGFKPFCLAKSALRVSKRNQRGKRRSTILNDERARTPGAWRGPAPAKPGVLRGGRMPGPGGKPHPPRGLSIFPCCAASSRAGKRRWPSFDFAQDKLYFILFFEGPHRRAVPGAGSQQRGGWGDAPATSARQAPQHRRDKPGRSFGYAQDRLRGGATGVNLGRVKYENCENFFRVISLEYLTNNLTDRIC